MNSQSAKFETSSTSLLEMEQSSLQYSCVRIDFCLDSTEKSKTGKHSEGMTERSKQTSNCIENDDHVSVLVILGIISSC